MNEQTTKILQTLIDTLGKSTDVITSELLKYYLIMGALHLVLSATVAGIVFKSFLSAARYCQVSVEAGTVATVWTSIFKILSVVTLVGALIYSYPDIKETIKVSAAPHVFLLEKARELTRK